MDLAFSGLSVDRATSIVARRFNSQVSICSHAPATITGAWTVTTPEQAARVLSSSGINVSYRDRTFFVGCTGRLAPAQETATAGDALALDDPNDLAPTMPLADGLSAGQFPSPAQAPSAAPAPPPPDLKTRVLEPEWLSVSEITELFSQLPGLQVFTPSARSRRVVVVAERDRLDEAEALLDALDQCPVEVAIESSVFSRSTRANRDRGVGVGLSLFGGRIRFGNRTQAAATGALLDTGSLDLAVEAGKERSTFRQLYRSTSRVLLGYPLTLTDGADVPVPRGTIRTDIETRQEVEYRATGQTLSVTVSAASRGYLVGELTHEVSSPAESSSLGPSFQTRRVATTFRVREGEPVILSLSDLARDDSANRLRLFDVGQVENHADQDAFLRLVFQTSDCQAVAPITRDGHNRVTRDQNDSQDAPRNRDS